MPADPVVIREGADVALGRERDALVVEEGGSNPAARAAHTNVSNLHKGLNSFTPMIDTEVKRR